MPLVRAYHSLRSKEWERTLPPVSAIKKHQSFFKPWCKRFYALHTAPLGKPRVEIGTEYPDLVRGLSPVLSAKPSPLPRVTALLRQSERTYTLQCRSASGLRTPFLCAPREITREAVFLNMPIFICKLIMNLLSDFVNIFTQKIVKTARTEARRTVLILSTHFRLRAHGAGQNATFEHEMSTVLKMEMWRTHPCSNRFCNGIFYSCSILF